MALVTMIFVPACSYLAPQSANEYTVTKKSPLVIPPDMNMTPPSKNEKKIRLKKNKSTKTTNDFNLEEILTGEFSNKKNSNFNTKKKVTIDRLNIVKILLKKKEITTLK